MTLSDIARRATQEVAEVLERALPDAVDAMAAPILSARRIALFGVGREGLMIKALAMRLFHMGLDVHVVGDMTTPHIGAGDLLIVSAGPGYFATVDGLMQQASAAGARTLVITAEPEGRLAAQADHVAHLPAQTMARDLGAPASILPMGSLYEAAMFLFFEVLILHLRDESGVTSDQMRAAHTNME